MVDLLRERSRGAVGPARRLLDDLAGEPLALSIFVLCELEAGVARVRQPSRERERIRVVCEGIDVVLPGPRLPSAFGSLMATVLARGRTIAPFDALIAATAIVDDAILVTRNRKHFENIPGLELRWY